MCRTISGQFILRLPSYFNSYALLAYLPKFCFARHHISESHCSYLQMGSSHFCAHSHVIFQFVVNSAFHWNLGLQKKIVTAHWQILFAISRFGISTQKTCGMEEIMITPKPPIWLDCMVSCMKFIITLASTDFAALFIIIKCVLQVCLWMWTSSVKNFNVTMCVMNNN